MRSKLQQCAIITISTRENLEILSDDATHIEKTAYIIENRIKITVDPLKYGIGNVII